MATINLGRVKGDPFRYEDFTPEQLAGLKGESFKFEDFTPEELESISAKVEVGTVTTLDAGEEATVTAKVEGNVTKLNFGIPQGEDAPTFTGTAAEYEAIADTIEDGTLINITDDFVEGETLDTHVLNKVNELEGKLGSSVKTREELMANGEEGKLADALAIKETIKDYGHTFTEYNYFNSLEEFVIATNNELKVPKIGRFADVNHTWAPQTGIENSWYRFMIVYQNLYTTGTTNSVYGHGIFWNDDGYMWNVYIAGNKDAGLRVKYEQLNKPTITNRTDLMANTVTGLFPDAVAVKDAFKYYNVAKNMSIDIATPEEFLNVVAYEKEVDIPRMFRFKDTGAWGPKKTLNDWYQVIIVGQNGYYTGQNNPTFINGIIFTQNGDMWSIHVNGKNGESSTVIFRSMIYNSYILPVENIPIDNVELKFNNVGVNDGLTQNDFTISKISIRNYSGDMHHILSVALKCSKKIPEGTIIELTIPNITTNIDGNTAITHYDPIYQFGMNVVSGNVFRIVCNKELPANFGIGVRLSYYTHRSHSSVLTS